jgi:hypothetical protein
MDAFNIFFTSTGRRVALIQSFKKVLMDLGVPGTIVTTDSQKNAPAAFAADVSELFPRITDANYINILLGICEKHQIKLLISLFNPGQSSGYFHDDYKLGIIASGVFKDFQVNENYLSDSQKNNTIKRGIILLGKCVANCNAKGNYLQVESGVKIELLHSSLETVKP